VRTWATLSFAGPGGRRRITLAAHRVRVARARTTRVVFVIPSRTRKLIAKTLRAEGRVALVLAAEAKAADGGSALAYDRVPFR
jgi:hypothetical protein